MKEHRDCRRVPVQQDIMFANRLIHPNCYFGAATVNISKGGICLSSRYQVVEGDSLFLCVIGDELQSDCLISELTCMVDVKWCQKIGTEKEPLYHVGLEYSDDRIPKAFLSDNTLLTVEK
ncbi:MAG: PilZ domain-containing protein [Thermodesulfobacteriota bacterium]